jgi:hypothetical protein
MTTDTTFSSPAPQPFPAPPVPARPKRGTAAIVVGAVLVGSGFLTAASGGALLAVFGGGQAVSSGEHAISTSTSAVVADLGHIDDIHGFEFLTGSPTLHISAENVTEKGVFVGVGPTAEVNRYLDGVAIEEVRDLDLSPFHLDTIRDEGSVVAQAPGEQDFWAAAAESSNTADLNWQIEEGDYEIVVMNADGSAGVLTSASIGASLPTSTGLWILVLTIGVLIMAGGGALIYAGVRQGRPQRPTVEN